MIRPRYWIPFLLILVGLVSFLRAEPTAKPQANPNREYKVGLETFFEVTKKIRDQYEKESDLASLYERAWKSLESVLPATAELDAATVSLHASSEEIRNFYAGRIDSVIRQFAHEWALNPPAANPKDTTVALEEKSAIRSATPENGVIPSPTAEEKKKEEKPHTVRELWTQATSGLVGGLHDPFSQFLPPKENEELQRVLSGKPDESKQFYGIGISVDWDTESDAGLLVVAPLPDTPAAQNDIRAGDVVVAVDGEKLKDWQGNPADKLDKAIKKIKGEKGTKVSLTLKRPKVPELIEKNVTRAPINPEQYLYKEMLDDEVGLIQLRNFHAQAAQDVLQALRYLKLAGMKKLVFDLRFNPGGYLDQAVKVAEIFLKKDSLITYTYGRTSPHKYFYSENTGDEGFTDIPMVVLVHQWSASASEVVTGALKDNKRAVIVGKKSFGKGSVQEVFNLKEGAGLRLTVAHYYTPSGVCIHEIGIQPDLDVDPITEEEFKKIKDKDYTHVSRLERRFDWDYQVKAAYQLLRGEITVDSYKNKKASGENTVKADQSDSAKLDDTEKKHE